MVVYSAYTDEQLFGLLQNGNEPAFVELYNRYWKLLYYVAFKRLNDFNESEEIVQEVFADIWARRQTIILHRSLKYYLAAAAQYQVMTQLTKRKRKRCLENYSDQHLTGTETADQFIHFHELQWQLENLVAALPEKCRLIYQLSREEGLTNKEIASQLNISEKTVENQLTKALSRIRKGLGDAALLHLLYGIISQD